MAGHVIPRKVCAKDACRGTIRKQDAPPAKRDTLDHWQAGRCTRCGGAKFRKKWRARYPDPAYGGRKEIERNFDRRTDADRWLRTQQVSVDRGLHIDPTRATHTVVVVVDAWRSTWAELEPKTKAGYDSVLKKHVLPRWGDVQIGAVDAGAVQDWVNDLATSGRAPKTVRNIFDVLQSVLRVGVERRFITVNPCDAVRLPRRAAYGEKGEKREMLFLSSQEVAALAEAITPRHRVLIYTAAYSGLRAGELGALRRKDVDLLHGKLSVSRALKNINSSSEHLTPDEKGLIFGPTKTGKDRKVGIPKFLVVMLTEHLATIPADPDALVFANREGGPRDHGNFVRRHYKPAVRRRYCAKCDTTVKPKAERCPECRADSDDLVYVLDPSKHRLRFHDLRHTCATLLIAANAPAFAIQRHLGHADIQTTYNVYGHLLPDVEDDLANSLDNAFNAGSADQDDEDDIPRIGKG